MTVVESYMEEVPGLVLQRKGCRRSDLIIDGRKVGAQPTTRVWKKLTLETA